MRSKRFSSTCLLLPLLLPTPVSALVVDIQGTRMEAQLEGGSCVDISGEYPGVTVETSTAGKTPRICHSSAQQDSIMILNALFIAKPPAKQVVSIKFEHDFPTGINGKVMARARLQGFFSTGDGVGVPTGDKLSLAAFFSQSGHDDSIAEPLDVTVGDQMDSALFEYSVKKPYLISGPRTLKGVLKVIFNQPGHKLTLREISGISIDTGSSFQDRLDTMEIREESDEAEPADRTPVRPFQGSDGTPPTP
jgi:hypothetical protein